MTMTIFESTELLTLSGQQILPLSLFWLVDDDSLSCKQGDDNSKQ